MKVYKIGSYKGMDEAHHGKKATIYADWEKPYLKLLAFFEGQDEGISVDPHWVRCFID